MASKLLQTTSSLSQLPRSSSYDTSVGFSILRRPLSRAYKGSTSSPASPKPEIPDQTPPLPKFNLFQQIRDTRPAVRYTVYAGLGLMVTVESTFWFHVIKAKLFPSASEEEQEKAEEITESVRDAIAGYKASWMRNYRRYYGGYIWGIGER